MYTVIGADGLQYGPVSLETLKQWLREGRIEPRTRVLVQATNEWKVLSELPEFRSQPPPPIAPPRPAYAQAPRTNGLATAGLVCGLISLTFGFCCCYGFPFNLAGLVLSGIALMDIRNDPVNQQGHGLAIAGLVTSGLSLLLTLLFFGIFSVIGAFQSVGRHHGW